MKIVDFFSRVYTGLFVLRKGYWLTKIDDSGDDDARRISQAAWMHGMRKSLSPLNGAERWILLQNSSGEQGPNVHLSIMGGW